MSSKTNTLFVTATDDGFVDIAMGLLESLAPFKSALGFDVGLLDLDLSDQNKEHIEPWVDITRRPDWDVPASDQIRKEKPYLRAMSARPFLPNYFPEYAQIIWLDADTWVQEAFALEWLMASTQDGAMGIVPQSNRSYVHSQGHLAWRMRGLYRYFGDHAVRLAHYNTYYNSGVFALRADAPHWQAWGEYMVRGVKNCGESVTDQSAANYAIWNEQLPVHPLPALCNWCCHLAMPAVDPQNNKLIEPHIPNRDIGIVHMTADTQDAKINISTPAGPVTGSLRYKGQQIHDE